MKYSVVDLGTNSARLMIARMENGRAVSEYKTLRTIRLGENMVNGGGITQDAMRRAAATLNEFKAISEGRGAAGFYCFATSAVREAGNRDAFVEYIRRECGVEIDVISGDDEAAIGFAGSVPDGGGMFDIGGGSTEVIFGKPGRIEYKRSFGIGTVKMLQMFPAADEADKGALSAAHELAERTFSELPDTKGFRFTGIGGTATALAAIDLKLKEYSAERVQGHRISLKRAAGLCRMLESKTKREREGIIGLEENRADVIVFGAIIMLEFMKKINADGITVSDRDNQEGYLEMRLGGRASQALSIRVEQ